MVLSLHQRIIRAFINHYFIYENLVIRLGNVDGRAGFKTSIHYVPHRRGGGRIVFGADPVGVGMMLSCVQDIEFQNYYQP